MFGMSDAFLQALIFFSLIALVLFIIGAKIVHDDKQRNKHLNK